MRPLRSPLLAACLAAAGLFLTFVHDYTYRRAGGTDYELGGYISHAGTDMLIVTAALTLVALLWGRR